RLDLLQHRRDGPVVVSGLGLGDRVQRLVEAHQQQIVLDEAVMLLVAVYRLVQSERVVPDNFLLDIRFEEGQGKEVERKKKQDHRKERDQELDEQGIPFQL
ncbi:MAG: hypothetical protein K0R28_743, partial [Paenibacillus sp.]|nr:hypothetical protein [Paenibacillus sp.]